MMTNIWMQLLHMLRLLWPSQQRGCTGYCVMHSARARHKYSYASPTSRKNRLGLCRFSAQWNRLDWKSRVCSTQISIAISIMIFCTVEHPFTESWTLQRQHQLSGISIEDKYLINHCEKIRNMEENDYLKCFLTKTGVLLDWKRWSKNWQHSSTYWLVVDLALSAHYLCCQFFFWSALSVHQNSSFC